MSKLNNFTSTGNKILRHPGLMTLLRSGRAMPWSLQLAPTNKCNLKCSFCSVVQRDKTEEMSFNDVVEALELFRMLGARTVEITGGGEPMCHPDINKIIYCARSLGYEVGMITNGVLLDRLAYPEFLTWLRISANCIDYGKIPIIPKLRDGAYLGFSYCFDFDGDSSVGNLIKVKELAIKHEAQYVRVVPNCLGDVAGKHERIKEIVRKVGGPLFYQEKIKDTFDQCWIGYLKPFLNADGYVYPCSSTVLNDDADKQFNPKYRWYHWTKAEQIYEGKIKPLDGSFCPDCVFTANNRTYDYIAGEKQPCEQFL